ncbi:MAG TPA: ABC transporter permease [Paracoccus sp.]|nr:ABC transporter permease [Paracoccus sp. (in: a-proteobacteria)]
MRFPEGLRPATRGTAQGYAPLRSIMALILREMATRFGSKPGGYIWAILQPLGLILMLAFAFSLLQRSPALGTSYILFKATGLLVFQMFKQNSSVIAKSLSSASSLLEYPRIAWIDAILARFLLNIMIGLIVSWIILGGVIIYEDIRTILDWSKILTAYGLAALMALGVGTLNIYMFMRFPVLENIWRILTAPLMIMSGVIMLYDDMPYLAQYYLWYNPLMHITGLMREGFYPVYRAEYISVTYVLLWALIPMVLGLLLVRRNHRELLAR